MSRKAKFITSWRNMRVSTTTFMPRRPDKKAFPPHGEVTIAFALMVDNNKYHPKTARRMKEERKAIARCLNGAVDWRGVVLPEEMERANVRG